MLLSFVSTLRKLMLTLHVVLNIILIAVLYTIFFFIGYFGALVAQYAFQRFTRWYEARKESRKTEGDFVKALTILKDLRSYGASQPLEAV